MPFLNGTVGVIREYAMGVCKSELRFREGHPVLFLVLAIFLRIPCKPRETLNKSSAALSKYETQTGGIYYETNDIRDDQRIRGAR